MQEQLCYQSHPILEPHRRGLWSFEFLYNFPTFTAGCGRDHWRKKARNGVEGFQRQGVQRWEKAARLEGRSCDPRRHPGQWSAARVIAATGTSQLEFLAALTESTDVDWGRVELFHLDEYIGLPATHPASFRKILLERLVNKTRIAKFHPLDGDARDLPDVIRRLGTAVASAAVDDIAFVGVGENGHLAFNDPPADFETEEPYLCRQP